MNGWKQTGTRATRLFALRRDNQLCASQLGAVFLGNKHANDRSSILYSTMRLLDAPCCHVVIAKHLQARQVSCSLSNRTHRKRRDALLQASPPKKKSKTVGTYHPGCCDESACEVEVCGSSSPSCRQQCMLSPGRKELNLVLVGDGRVVARVLIPSGGSRGADRSPPDEDYPQLCECETRQ